MEGCQRPKVVYLFQSVLSWSRAIFVSDPFLGVLVLRSGLRLCLCFTEVNLAGTRVLLSCVFAVLISFMAVWRQELGCKAESVCEREALAMRWAPNACVCESGHGGALGAWGCRGVSLEVPVCFSPASNMFWSAAVVAEWGRAANAELG